MPYWRGVNAHYIILEKLTYSLNLLHCHPFILLSLLYRWCQQTINLCVSAATRSMNVIFLVHHLLVLKRTLGRRGFVPHNVQTISGYVICGFFFGLLFLDLFLNYPIIFMWMWCFVMFMLNKFVKERNFFAENELKQFAAMFSFSAYIISDCFFVLVRY